MKRVEKFLKAVEGDIFKLLPMKEGEVDGEENYLTSYLESLIINLRGGMIEYMELSDCKKYIYIVNNLQYIKSNPVEFSQWRRIILDSTKVINNLRNDLKETS